MEKSRGGFYDPWEKLPEEKRRILIRENLSEYVHFASQSLGFYRERLADFSPQDDFPLAKVPVLTSSDLRQVLPPVSDALVVGGVKDYTVFQSGGTTGVPKTTLFSHAELERLNALNARGFFAAGLVESDRVGNFFAVGGLYMTFIHINRMLQQYGCMNFPFSNHTPADFVNTVAQLFKINCFTGIASVVLSTLREISASKNEIHVEKIYYGGEHLYEADKNELKSRYGAKVVLAPGYGTVDTWYLGYQCTQCPTGVFHAHDDEVYLEIVDEDTKHACGFGEPGMLYATTLTRRLTPIVRYRVGDRAHWIKEPCACGRTTPLFQLLGRGDDVLRIGYDSIDYAAIQELCGKIAGLSGSVQMEKRRQEGRDRLILRVESDNPMSDRAHLAVELTTALLESRPSLREFILKGTVWEPKVEILPFGALPRKSRTGKLLRVIDSIGDR